MRETIALGFWQGTTIGERAVPPTRDFAFLTLAGLILVFSFFLLHEAVSTVKSMLPDRPKPESGRTLSEVTAAAVVIVWFWWTLTGRGWEYSAGNILWEHMRHLLANPRELTPGLLLASFVPMAVAASKLALTITAPAADERAKAGARLAPIVQGGFVLLNAAASVVTLYKEIHH